MITEAEQHVKTAAQRRAEAQEKVVSGYVNAMTSNIGLAAVQEEAIIQFCQLMATGTDVQILVATGAMEVSCAHTHIRMVSLHPSARIRER